MVSDTADLKDDQMEPTAAIYARLSQERGEETSVQVQVQECRKAAEGLGYEVPSSLVFTDRNISASQRGTRRPAFEQLIELISQGRVTTVFVREQSRFYRKPRELEDLIDLVEDKQLRIHSLFGGDVNLTTSDGRAYARMMVTQDKRESERLGERVRMAKADLRAKGKYAGGPRPFGYDSAPGGGLVINPTEASHIKESATRILAGESLNRVVLDFNERSVTSAGGGKWTPSRLKRILVGRPDTLYRNGPLCAGGETWPAILTGDEVALLCARLTAPSKYRPTQPHVQARKYPLTGLIVCSLCGASMIGSGGYYRCATIRGGCGHVSITARTMEADLLHRIDNLRGYQDMAGKPQPDERSGVPVAPVDEEHRADLLRELHALEKRLAEVGAALADGTLSVHTASAAEANLIEKHKIINEELALSGPTKAPELPWDVLVEQDTDWMHRFKAGDLTALEIQDLHDAFAAWIASVKVAPRPDRRKSFNPDRITVTWQPGIAGVAWSSSNTSLSH